jgi:hypothetical protein
MGSTGSSTSDSYRPDLDSLPEDLFKDFAHGRISQYTEQRRKVEMANATLKGKNLTPWGATSGSIAMPPAPQRTGPRNIKTRPHSFTHEKHHSNFKVELRPQSPMLEKDPGYNRPNRRAGSGGYKAKRKQENTKARSNSFSNPEQAWESSQLLTTLDIGLGGKQLSHRKASFNSVEETKRASQTHAEVSSSMALDLSQYPPVRMTGPPTRGTPSAATRRKFLDKVADQAKKAA